MRTSPILVSALGLLALLSGCADNGSDETDLVAIPVTADTGGIRGVVVDDAIRPISGATVEVVNTDQAATTGEDGGYVITGLATGTYVVKASHPFYESAQQTVEVVAGVAEPKATKFQLIQVVFAEPYYLTQKFDGFIVCSAGLPGVGYSEECGEGVGVPCEVPVLGCQRAGGQENNEVQYDFTVDGPFVQTLLVEQVWTPSAQTAATGQLLTYVSTNWVCDPFCGGDQIAQGSGVSPIYIRADAETLDGFNLTADTLITTFTWANTDAMDPTGTTGIPNVILNQDYQLFVTASYYLPLPEAWSFVKGDAAPF